MARCQRIGSVVCCCVLLLWATACATPDVAGLRPLYPEPDRDYVEIDSRQPTLRWEAFPDAEFLDAAPSGIEDRIEDITYDLRIWRVVENYPASLVYARTELAEPQHRLEVPLDAGARYHWSIRARFSLDGQPRVGRWGTLVRGLCAGGDRLGRVPSPCHYRLATPEE